MTNFQDFYKQYQPKIDSFLADHLSVEIQNKMFAEIMKYSVMAGGKRLRPLLFLATLDSLKQEIDDRAIKIACGIELIHTYSLIHDDLPAMDNDDYRRGKLTSHKKWGEAQAILAGDALLPMGIQWIAEASQNSQMVQVIAEAIGPNGMAGGQYLDIDATNNDSVKNDANFINQMEWLKTGCLIEASVKMATIYAQASKDLQEKLVDFSRRFGRAYQIYDDLVDIVQSEQEAGKATHKDQEEGKNNTLTLLGADQSRIELKKLINLAQADLNLVDGEVLAGFLDLYQKVL